MSKSSVRLIVLLVVLVAMLHVHNVIGVYRAAERHQEVMDACSGASR